MTSLTPGITIEQLTAPRALADELADDVREGFTRRPPQLPPKHLYDERGSQLFEAITDLPEYHLTRTETEILETAASEVVEAARPQELLELGSGSSRKTRLLLEAMHEAGTGERYVPLDVSASALEDAARTLGRDYPWLEVRGYVGDFHTDLGRVPHHGRRVVAFLGSTIGNLDVAERSRLLEVIAASLTSEDHLLLGAHLVEDASILVPAYDDAQGVTAAFTRNLLTVLNRELDGDLPVEDFSHVARWDPDHQRVELALRANTAVAARLAAIDLPVRFAAGEELIVEHSHKFTLERLGDELAAAGLAVDRVWTDSQDRFALLLARR